MLRLFVSFAALFASPAFGQDKSEPTRRDLVAAIRKKLALDADAHSAKAKELDDVLTSAKKGVVNPSADSPIKPPKRPGTDAYTFKSVKIKNDFIAASEAAIKARETIHEDATKDLKKFIGYMGKPEMEAVGHLVSPNERDVMVKKVLDKRTVYLTMRYRTVVREKGKADRVVEAEEMVIASGFDTSKLVDDKPAKIDAVFYIGSTYDWDWKQRLHAKPVVLSDTEKILIREK